MGRLRLGTIVIGTVLLALSSSAFADIKAYHGGICRVVQTWAIRPDIYGYWQPKIDHYGLTNLSDTFNLVVMCPLIRDLTDHPTGPQIITELYNKNDGDFIRCAVTSQVEEQSPNTAAYDYLYQETTTIGYTQLDFGTLDATGIAGDANSGNEGSYAMRCEIGPGDAIKHIYVNETQGTD